MQARSIQTSISCGVLEQGEETTAENSGANASVAGAGRRRCRLAERRARHAHLWWWLLLDVTATGEEPRPITRSPFL